jgi:CAAX prenyl protease-like protein
VIAPLAALRANQTAAHVVPLVVFLLFFALPPAFRIAHPVQPWWRQAPEHWVYPLQTLVSLLLVAWWWPRYRFRPCDARRFLFAAVVGIVGIAIWLLPGWLHRQFGWHLPAFGVASRAGPGFNPYLFPEGSAAWHSTVLLRFIRLTIAVPLVEEIFWRGFLWRYLADFDRPWFETPFGVPSVRALVGTSIFMMASHQWVDWPAAFVWSLLAGVVAIKTRSLGACVVCHAVSNLILGVYVMATRQWGYW